MKQKTHSGAKKRFRARPGGSVKRAQQGKRHKLERHSSKLKRQLGTKVNVDDANMYQMSRMLVL